MKVFWRFLIVELAWTAAIVALIVPVTILSSEPLTAAEYLGLLGSALELALLPAGISVAGPVFAPPRTWRPLLGALYAVVIPQLNDSMTLPRLAATMSAETSDWESRNHAAWVLYRALFAPVYAFLLAAIGVQVGAWTPHALPPALRRLLYWVVALGLIVSRYIVTDSTYEVVVLHTAALVDFAAFYGLLVPAGICAGLALPTLALVRGGETERLS
jgi:hypothetical protein